MFKRAFQVSLVKKSDDGSIQPTSVETQADFVAFASDAAKDLMHEGIKCVAAYMVMDTIRKVVITLVEK